MTLGELKNGIDDLSLEDLRELANYCLKSVEAKEDLYSMRKKTKEQSK